MKNGLTIYKSIHGFLEYEWYEIGLLVVLVSLLGFIVENVWLMFTKGYMDNRNMNLPFLLGYGIAAVAIYIFMGTPYNMIFFRKFTVKLPKLLTVVLYFLCAMIIVSVGEIALGMITEKLCNINYWNYTALPLHITKYTSVPTSIGFATGITFFMGKCFPYIMESFQAMNRSYVGWAATIMLSALTIDFFYCYAQMIKKRNFYDKWRINIPLSKKIYE